MQRRSARSFLEEVLLKIPDLPPETRDKLLDAVDDKPGTKRASKLAAIIASAEKKDA
jgi:hypothetical protein